MRRIGSYRWRVADGKHRSADGHVRASWAASGAGGNSGGSDDPRSYRAYGSPIRERHFTRMQIVLKTSLIRIGKVFLFFGLVPCASRAAEKFPPLRPPRDLVPATFWEQHFWEMIFGAAAVIGMIVLLARWLRRPKPVVIIPPEVVAWQALEPLGARPEDGQLVEEVSQILRCYLRSVFGFQRDELTTEELGLALTRHALAHPDLAAEMGHFLHECDVRKFAPTPPVLTPGLVARASGLVARIHSCQQAASRSALPAPRHPTPALTSWFCV